MTEREGEPIRPVIMGTLVVCLALAMAPWFSGGQEPVAMFVSGAVLLLGALLVWRQPQVRVLGWGVLAGAFVGLVGLALLSLLWSANRYSTVLWAVQWLMAGLAFWLAYTIAGEQRGREWVLRAYLVTAGIFSMVAVWLFLTNSYARLTGWFYWPNPAAAYLIPAVVLSLDRMRRAKDRMQWWWLSATAGLLAAFWLTNSRAAMVVLALVVGVYLLLVKLSRRFWITLLCTLALSFAAGIGLTLLSTITAHHSSILVPGSRFAQLASGEPTSLKDRLNYVDSAFQMWLTHPVGGFGAGTYGDVHPQFQQRVVSASINAHDLYAQTLAELGLVGIVALAALGLALLAGVARGLVHEPELLAVVLGVAGLLVHFGLDIDASYPALLVLAAILLGLAYRRREERRGTSSWHWAVVGLVVTAAAVSLYQSASWAARGQVAQANGDYATATLDYASAHRGVVYDPDYVDAEGIDWYALAAAGGTAAQTNGYSNIALVLARRAERLDPHDAQHYQLEGRVLELRGNLRGAQTAFRTALRLDPYNHPDYALDLASAQLVGGNLDGAARTAKAMLALYPKAVVNNRNLDTSIKPELANLEVVVGSVDLQNGDVDGARAAARQALYLDPGSVRGRALVHEVSRAVARRLAQP